MNDGVARLGLLASAIARRPLAVAASAPGEPAWTDGKVVFVDVHKSAHAQIEALVVQASLLSAGSLDYDIVHGLARRTKLARRYLALEGHRALAAVEPLLPPAVRPLIDADVAALSGSPAASLALARERSPAALPPESFGTIWPRRLLQSIRSAQGSQASRSHAARDARALTELAELADEASSDDPAEDSVSSSVGGGGAIGRWLSKLLTAVRPLRGGGAPGADTPTHWTRSGKRGGGSALFSSAASQIPDELAVAGRTQGCTYPEWDAHARRYREDWCTVIETAPELERESERDVPPAVALDRSGLRRSLARLGTGIDRQHRQAQGDDIDIDAAVAARVELMAGATPDDALFIHNVRRRRNLSVLLLLDISGSAAEPAANGQTVHAQQCAAAAALALTLHELGDRVALYAYRSQGRDAVRVMPIKRFGADRGALAQQRLCALEPGAYSRLGAAVRHGTAVLQRHGGTPRQLLVVLSDGLAYDHGYELAYGAADSRRALDEARQRGVGCLCLSVGASTDSETLRRVFGASAHAALAAPEQLKRVIGPLFRSAIRSADVRRRLS